MPPNFGLQPKEREFCYEYFFTDNLSGSYNKVFGEDPKAWEKGKKLIESPHVKRFLEHLNLPRAEKAYALLEDKMDWSNDGDESFKAAKELVKIEERQGVKEATDRWIELANQICAQPKLVPNQATLDKLGEAFRKGEPVPFSFAAFLNGEVILDLPLAQSSPS